MAEGNPLSLLPADISNLRPRQGANKWVTGRPAPQRAKLTHAFARHGGSVPALPATRACACLRVPVGPAHSEPPMTPGVDRAPGTANRITRRFCKVLACSQRPARRAEDTSAFLGPPLRWMSAIRPSALPKAAGGCWGRNASVALPGLWPPVGLGQWATPGGLEGGGEGLPSLPFGVVYVP